MPYKVFPEGGKSAVYAVGPDGKKVGKRRGLHDTPKDAQGQIAAITANEKKPKKEVVYIGGGAAPEDVEAAKQATWTVATSDTSDETETKDYYGNPVEVVLVESSCGPLTFADLLAEEEAREAVYEMEALNYKLQRLINNIMASDSEDKAGALVALTNEYAALVQKEIQDSDDKAASIAKQIAGDNQPVKEQPVEESPVLDPESKSLFIWKEDNTYRWLAAYSNNRRDDDNPPEIICSASHKEFDEALNKGEWPMPELWPWHIPFPVGVATFHAYDEESGFPIAGGYFYKGMEWAAEGMIEAGWDGTSHGMPSEWIQRDKEVPTVLIRHRTKEISPLPNWAAANKLAFFIINKESNMADEKGLPPHKRDEFVKAFGEERVKQIEATLTDKAKEADEAGIEKKEQSQAAQKDAAPVAEEKPLTQTDLLKALEFVSDGIKTALGNLDNRLKAIEEAQVEEKDKFDIVEILKAKSIIGQSAARIDGRSGLAKDAPQETKPETPTVAATGGVPIGLVDGLFQLNQDYYSGGKR